MISRKSANTSRLLFILGHPVEHSLSPAMQNEALRKLKLPWLYLPLDVSPGKIKATLKYLKTTDFQGANVTVPYKEEVLPLLDYVEPTAKWLGSVNTLYWKGRKLWGTSTDGEGFLRSLGKFRKKLRGTRGLLLGAGGAAKAVAGALAMEGVKGIWIANRSLSRAEKLVQVLGKRFPKLEFAAVSLKVAPKFLPMSQWLIQATSIGLKKGDRSPVSLEGARPSLWVIDLIYHRETALLNEARRRGLKRIGGIGMLLHQGALSFERWTGKKAPLREMRKVLLDSLASRRT